MYKFGKKSKEQRATLHSDLKEIVDEAIKIIDFTIIEGHRDKERQNKAFDLGRSKLQYPNSKHNKNPSDAMDIAPWVDGGIPWDNREKFFELAGVIKAIAHTKGIKITWGGDFKSFFDGPHFQREE